MSDSLDELFVCPGSLRHDVIVYEHQFGSGGFAVAT